MKKVFFLLFSFLSLASYSQIVQRNKIVLQIANGDTLASVIHADSTAFWSSNPIVFQRNNVTINKNIYVKGLKTVSSHPISYKGLFVDMATGKIYSQNTATSIGNADSLGHRSPRYYRDTFDVAYCNSCALASGWKRSGDTIKIDTSYFGSLRKLNDSIASHRISINAIFDSLAEHRIVLNAHSDSISNLRTETQRLNDTTIDLRTDINAQYDSISDHRIILNAHSDSIDDLRQDINSIKDSLPEFIRYRDTSFIATHYWTTTNFMPINANTHDSIYAKFGAVNSPDGWIVDTLKIKNDYLTVESDPIWIADSSNYYKKGVVDNLLLAKQNLTDTTTYDATKYDVAKMVTDSGVFDGNRAVLRSGWTGVSGVNMGTSTTRDFLEAVFFPFVPATISINGNYLSEVGTSNVVTISGTTTVNSETIFSLGKVVWTYPLPIADYYSFGASTSYSTTFSFEPMQDSTLGVNATEVRFTSQQLTGNNGSPATIYSSTKYLQSVYPYLYGMDSTTALISGGTAFYSAMTKSVAAYAATKIIPYNSASLKYFWFAYPATYADLTSIKDQNNFEQITNFTKYTVNVGSVGLTNNYDVSYKIYRSNATYFTVGTWNYTFTY